METAKKWLQKSWWGIIIAYPVLFMAVYLAIWQVAEPIGIPDNLNEIPNFVHFRFFIHLLITLVVTPHLVIILTLLMRRSELVTCSDLQQQNALTVDDIPRIGVIDTGYEDEPKKNETPEQQPDAVEDIKLQIEGLLLSGKSFFVRDFMSKTNFRGSNEEKPAIILNALALLGQEGKVQQGSFSGSYAKGKGSPEQVKDNIDLPKFLTKYVQDNFLKDYNRNFITTTSFSRLNEEFKKFSNATPAETKFMFMKHNIVDEEGDLTPLGAQLLRQLASI